MSEETKAAIVETLEEAESDLSIQEIGEKVGVSRQTASKWIKTLNGEGRIVKTRNVGNAQFFDVRKEEYARR